MPADLKGYDIEDSKKVKEEIAQLALQDSCTTTNPTQPNPEDIIAILDKLR